MNSTQKLHQANLAKWSALFKEQADSGSTVKDWCDQNSISIHAFYYWKRVAKEAYMSSIMPEIVPITMDISPVSSEAPVKSTTDDLYNSDNLHELTPVYPKRISVSVGDIHIEIGTDASDDMISKVIKAVRYA